MRLRNVWVCATYVFVCECVGVSDLVRAFVCVCVRVIEGEQLLAQCVCACGRIRALLCVVQTTCSCISYILFVILRARCVLDRCLPACASRSSSFVSSAVIHCLSVFSRHALLGASLIYLSILLGNGSNTWRNDPATQSTCDAGDQVYLYTIVISSEKQRSPSALYI